MNVLRTLFVWFVSVWIVACATAAPAATPTPAPPVQLRIIPKTLRPGTRATMVGGGFERGERITLYLIRPDGTRTTEEESTADKNGGVGYELDVMDDWQPGQYTAHIESKKNPARSAEQKVDVLRR